MYPRKFVLRARCPAGGSLHGGAGVDFCVMLGTRRLATRASRLSASLTPRTSPGGALRAAPLLQGLEALRTPKTHCGLYQQGPGTCRTVRHQSAAARAKRANAERGSSQSVSSQSAGPASQSGLSSPTKSTSVAIPPCPTQSFQTPHGRIKIDLASPKTIGASISRGERPYQEDATLVTSITVPTSSLRNNIVTLAGGAGWAPEFDELAHHTGSAGFVDVQRTDDMLRQVALCGVFDGHGGSGVSQYVSRALPGLITAAAAASRESIAETVGAYKKYGKFLRRYEGGILAKTLERSSLNTLALDEMCTLAFLRADSAVLGDDTLENAGSVGTIALLHSLDVPYAVPFYASSLLALTIAHVGDTRALLASRPYGTAQPVTETHHPDSITEGERLRKLGIGLVTDSFGETRWYGALANTRSFGDRPYKELGVIAEPAITKRVLKGSEWAFLVLVTDGITDVVSDQEIIDLCRGAKTPGEASRTIVDFAEEAGGDASDRVIDVSGHRVAQIYVGEDNMSAIVVPLPGWGYLGGSDSTSKRRAYRVKQAQGQRRQKRM